MRITNLAVLTLSLLATAPEARASDLSELKEKFLGLSIKPEIEVMIGSESSGKLKPSEKLRPEQLSCLNMQLDELEAGLKERSQRAADFLKEIFKVDRISVKLVDNANGRADDATLPHHFKKLAYDAGGKTRAVELAFSLKTDAKDCKKTLFTREAIQKIVDEWAKDSGVETITLSHAKVDDENSVKSAARKGPVKLEPAKPGTWQAGPKRIDPPGH